MVPKFNWSVFRSRVISKGNLGGIFSIFMHLHEFDYESPCFYPSIFLLNTTSVSLQSNYYYFLFPSIQCKYKDLLTPSFPSIEDLAFLLFLYHNSVQLIMQIFDHSLDFERRSALASIKTPKIILERWHDPKTDKKGGLLLR